jgi:integrase
MAASTNGKVDIGDYRSIRLQQNKGGYWEVRWSQRIGGDYLGQRESTKSKDQKEAQAYLAGFCADLRALTAGAAVRPPTIDELCDRWLGFVAPQGPRKVRTGRYAVAPVQRELGRYTAEQLNEDILRDYCARRGVSAGSLQRELRGGLRTVLNLASRKGWIGLSPTDIRNLFEGIAAEGGPPRQRFLTLDEEQQFWDAAIAWGDVTKHSDPQVARGARRLMLFIALGMETAARREAILQLTWDRVDLAQGTIDYQVPGQRLTKKRRVQGLDISDRLMPVLKEAWLQAPKDAEGRATGPVVGGGTSNIEYLFSRFAAGLGMPDITPHVLRHTWASLALMAGTPMWDVAQVLGDTMATVESTYGHRAPGHLRAAVNFKRKTG